MNALSRNGRNPLASMCVKCGTGNYARAAYVPPDASWIVRYPDVSDPMQTIDRLRHFDGECLVLTCVKCGYQWREECADAEDAK